MKILIATGLYPPDIGGPATYTVFLEKHLERHGVAYEVLPYNIVRKYPKIIRHVAYLVKLLLRARGVTVFYALDTVSVGLPVCIAGFITRKPYLLRVPGDYAWEQGQQRYGVTELLDTFQLRKKYPLPVRVLVCIQRLVARRALHIIAPSEYMKGIVALWGLSIQNITRVYTELKEIFIVDSKEVLRDGFHYTGFVISTAARFVPWKGLDGVIRVTHILREEGLPVSLEIIGDGVLRNSLEALVDTLHARAYIHFLGAISHQEVGRRVKSADVFVLNTSYEGLSHHLIEAMSLETPIITTPVGGNRELIEDMKTGIFVPYQDDVALAQAIRQLIQDVSLGKMLARDAKKKVSHFHEDVVIEEFVRLLHTLWKF